MGSSGSTFWASLFRLATILLVGLTACELALGQNDGLDLDGKTVNPLEAASGRIVVLIFIRRDCPVSNRYAPVIRQISAQHEHDASFWLVFPDKTDTAEMIQRYLREYSYGLRALRDPEHALVKLAHVQITPEVAVFNRNHQLIYDGRIDNWYVDLGRSRAAPTTHELDDALQKGVAEKTPAVKQVRGVGCYISDLE
jgi:hypothetical protein